MASTSPHSPALSPENDNTRPPPTHSPENVSSAQPACSESCAHRWALAPSGSFLPGTPVSQVTCGQLDSHNLTALTIFAESLATRSQPLKKTDGSYETPSQNPTSCQPDFFYCISSAKPSGDSKTWSAEYQVSNEYYNALVNSWSSLSFECLHERLFYQTGASGDPSEAALTWYWQEIATPSRAIPTEGSCVMKFHGVRLCESTFIKSLLLPDQRRPADLAAQSLERSTKPRLKRSQSSPELRNLAAKDDNVAPNVVNDTGPFVAHSTQSTDFTQPTAKPESSSLQSASSQLAAIARDELIQRSSPSGNDVVQSVTGIVGAVATVVGSVASVALWMRKRNTDQVEQPVEPGIELQRLDGSAHGATSGVPPSMSPPAQEHQVDEPVDSTIELQRLVGSNRRTTSDAPSTSPAPTVSPTQEPLTAGATGPYTESHTHAQFSMPYHYTQPMYHHHHPYNPSRSFWSYSPEYSYTEVQEMEAQHGLAISQLKTQLSSAQQKSREVESQRDDLLDQLTTRDSMTKDLQEERYKVVLQDLVTTCRSTELEKARQEFDARVEAEVRSRVQRQTVRVEAEAKRQKHNREVQDALQNSLEVRTADLDKQFVQLKDEQMELEEKQTDFALHQRAQGLEDARLRNKARELLDIQQLLTNLTKKHEESCLREKKRYAAVAKDLKTRETKWKADVLQQRLELARREARVKGMANDA